MQSLIALAGNLEHGSQGSRVGRGPIGRPVFLLEDSLSTA